MSSQKIFVIPDALADPRFKDSVMVVSDPFIRFYASAQLVSDDGYVLGCLAVADHVPRDPSQELLSTLDHLSAVVMTFAELNRTSTILHQLFSMDRDFHARLLRASRDLGESSQSTDELLLRLINCLDPKFGWLSARIMNLQTGTIQIMANPELARGVEIPDLWNVVGINDTDTEKKGGNLPYISSAPINPAWFRLVIPISVRKKHLATFEFIYPEGRFSKRVANDILHLMASNLMVISELVLGDHYFREQLTIDPETGASNRSQIMDGMAQLIRQADYNRPNAAVLYIDLNNFQEVNDAFGYLVGDSLLKAIAARLMGIRRKNDVLGRLSGDDFIILAKDMSINDGDLDALISSIHSCFDQPFDALGHEVHVSANIGAVVLTDPRITTEKLLRNAEKAMSKVKSGQLRRAYIAEIDMLQELDTRRGMDSKFRKAFLGNSLTLHYQPIVELESCRVCGAEALLRITEADGTIISAGEFLHSLIGQDLLMSIDEWVMLESIKNFNQHSAELMKTDEFFLSINITPETLSRLDYASSCLTLMQCGQIPAKSFVLEISENSILTSSDIVLDNLNIFHEAGVGIAVDDFGTGFSNLERLATLPVNYLKVDRSLIAAMGMGAKKREALLTTACAIGTNLGFAIVGEGVEGQDEADFLKTLGCKYAQGYLYGKAMPMKDLLTFMKANAAQPLSIAQA